MGEVTTRVSTAQIVNFPNGADAPQSEFFKKGRNDPYETPAATEQEMKARQRLPRKYADMALEGIGRRSNTVPKHNLICLGYAHAYADCGLRAIDAHTLNGNGKPSGSGGDCKNPRGAAWGSEATTDHDKLNRRWSGDGDYPPNKSGVVRSYAGHTAMRNVAVVMDEGYFVLDLDGEDGIQWVEEQEAIHGPLPPTVTARSGSGGFHYYLKSPNRKIRNSASAIAPNVDIRGKGGQALVPPSMHKSGNRYEWVDGCAPWECEIADAPEWLEDAAFFASKANQTEKTGSKKRKSSDKRASSAESGKSDARGLDAHLAEIGDGDGLRGFDGPIYAAACAYFAREGAEADAESLVDTLRDAVLAVPCKDGRAESRYATDEYLNTRVEQARAFIAETVDKSEWIKPPFKVKHGIILKMGADDDLDRPLCQVFDVVGRSSNLAGDAGAGRIIRFTNENGVDVEMTLDRSALFKADGGGVLDALADAGMDLRYSGKNGRGDMLDLLRTIKSDRQVPVAPHPGWTRDRAGHITGFLCPTGEFIAAGTDTPDMRLHSSATAKDRLPSGTLDEWKASAKEAKNNFHWTLGLCAGFAGPVLDLIEGLPCGVNLSGDSSLGKTIALMLGTTVWTSAVSGKGNFHVMNSTMNALEDLFTMGSGTLTALDEIGALQNPATLAPMLFGASSGAGKARKAGRGAGLSDSAEFCTVTLLTNEHGLKDTITGAGGTYKTGLSVRFPDVDVTAVKKVPADVLVKLDKAKENFGHAGPEFVRYLIAEGWHNKPEKLKKRVKDTADKIAGKDAAPALRRAAQVFALFQVAGKLAAEAGLIEKNPIKVNRPGFTGE